MTADNERPPGRPASATLALRERIQQEVRDHQSVVDALFSGQADAVEAVVDACARCLEQGGKILLAGNGGSAADCQHLAGELVGGFPSQGPARAALALTTDTSILTAVGNDFGFEQVFRRQVEALARPGDLLMVFSTSGNSTNLLEAVTAARRSSVTVVGLLGGDGGALRDLVDHAVIVPSSRPDRIQECHGIFGHLLSRLIDERKPGRE